MGEWVRVQQALDHRPSADTTAPHSPRTFSQPCAIPLTPTATLAPYLGVSLLEQQPAIIGVCPVLRSAAPQRCCAQNALVLEWGGEP